MRLSPAFGRCRVHFVTVHESYRREVAEAPFYTVRDASRWNPGALAVMAVQLLVILVKVRPRVVVSTGAAPGLFAVIIGKLTGARTIWLDSIANVRRPSLCGRLVRPFADACLTQWPHLAQPPARLFLGGVL